MLFQDGPNRTGTTRALDCGAGIGRITKRLLLPLFKTVDMVDVTEDFLTKAKSYLGEEGRRVRNYFCCGLQDFSPEPNSYDVIWIQWVIGEGCFACGVSPACPPSAFPQGARAPRTGESFGQESLRSALKMSITARVGGQVGDLPSVGTTRALHYGVFSPQALGGQGRAVGWIEPVGHKLETSN